ncbi:MAG: quinate 5-dehydrogenase [bacterium]
MSDSIHVVSVSLGSSLRDKSIIVTLGNFQVHIERIGTDGDMNAAIKMINDFDGKIDAIGLGGIDLYLIANGKKYTIRDARKMADAAKITPVVDGSGLKHTLERRVIQKISDDGIINFKDKKVLLVSGVDRFGMAEILPELGAKVMYGDVIFALGMPIPLRTLNQLKFIAALLLPIITIMPFDMIYPTGEKQEKTTSKYGKYFDEADIIAGDYHYINRYMPEKMQDKIIITNTTTAADIEKLRLRGVKMLISTTPEFDGRSFGTNVMEAVIIAMTKKRPEDMKPEDYLKTLDELGWQPRVVNLEEK